MIPRIQPRLSPNPAPLPAIASPLSLGSPGTGLPNANLFLFTFLRTLLQFLHQPKPQLFYFQVLPNSFTKNTGVWGTLSLEPSGTESYNGHFSTPLQQRFDVRD